MKNLFIIKLQSIFSTSQLLINVYTSPYRLDRNGKGGGNSVYFRENIPPGYYS